MPNAVQNIGPDGPVVRLPLPLEMWLLSPTACEHAMGDISRISIGKGKLTTGPSGPMFRIALGIHAFTERLLAMRRVE